jgi:hypothetical protein
MRSVLVASSPVIWNPSLCDSVLVMDWDKYKRKMQPVDRWAEDARQAGSDLHVAHAIEARLESEPDQEVRSRLNFELAMAYKMTGRYDEAERIYLMLFDQSPDEPMPLISLAGQKLYSRRIRRPRCR